MPNATYAPNICTGGMGVNIKERKPTAEVRDVNSIGVNKCSTTRDITILVLAPGR